MSYYSNEDDAKVVFPIPEEGISYSDAIETLCAIDQSSLCLTIYDEDGNSFSGDLHVSLIADYDKFFREKLIDLLRYEADGNIYDKDGNENINGEIPVDGWPVDRMGVDQAVKLNKSHRLIIRLIRAYEEWDRTDNKMSWEELKANPFPALKVDNDS